MGIVTQLHVFHALLELYQFHSPLEPIAVKKDTAQIFWEILQDIRTKQLVECNVQQSELRGKFSKVISPVKAFSCSESSEMGLADQKSLEFP